MTFKINGVEPTIIDVVYEKTGEKTTLNSLGTNTTNVWGKPYSLSIDAGANTSVTVTRTSSPNQGASTGTLSSGSVVYYGDVLTITASVSSGYKFETFTVNGTSWTSGNTITVTSAISVVTTAVASASWKTVWTGSKSASFSGDDGTVTKLSGLIAGVPTRVSGSFDWYEENTLWSDVTINFSNFEVGKYMNQKTDYTSGNINDFVIEAAPSSHRCYWTISSFDTTSLSIKRRREYISSDGAMFFLFYNYLLITKIEQYY